MATKKHKTAQKTRRRRRKSKAAAAMPMRKTARRHQAQVQRSQDAQDQRWQSNSPRA